MELHRCASQKQSQLLFCRTVEVSSKWQPNTHRFDSPELAHPLKVSLTGHSLSCQFCGNISGMHVHHNECTQGLALQLAQLASHLVHDLYMPTLIIVCVYVYVLCCAVP